MPRGVKAAKPAESVAARTRRTTGANNTDIPAPPATSGRFDAATIARIKLAQPWRPTAGDNIQGVIVAIVPRTGPYGRYPCVILDTGATNLTAVHSFHAVMESELREIHAGPGMDVTIAYAGKRKHNTEVDANGDPRLYHSYSVVPTDGADLEQYDFGAAEDIAPY